MKKILFPILVCAGLFVTACETTSSRPYSSSTKNIIAFKKAVPAGQKININTFTAADGVNINPTCRALGALEVSPGKDPIDFIQEALREEIFAAGVYDEAGTTIEGKLTSLVADSIGTGSWTIGLNLSSANNPAGINSETVYEFKSSYSAIRACQNVVDAFTPAVQDLISKVVADPNFDSLF